MNVKSALPPLLKYFLVLIVILCQTATILAQYVRTSSFSTEQQRRQQYALEDWISYSQSRRFTGITAGTHYIYFATSDGGILRYHIFENFWDYPYTISNGLPSNHVKEVVYDNKTGFLWAVTPGDVAIFNFASQEWIRKSQSEPWPYEFPVKEPPKSPNERNRFFNREDLANLPTFFANGSYSLLTDWILMDEHFQEFTITGYLRDLRDRIWFMVEGFGIGQGDLFTQRADFYRMGLPSVYPRAIAYQNDDLWIGGTGQPLKGLPGISVWAFNHSPMWRHFQAQWISQLPNDDVNDILVLGDSVWFATEYGVSLHDAGNDRWKNFSLSQGLISNRVKDLAVMGGYLYAGTDQGISRIQLLTGNVERIKDFRFVNTPFSRLAVQGDTLWAGTFRGIFRYADGFREWEFVPAKAAIQDLDVTAVDVFEQEVWFAAKSGVMFLDLRTGIWQSYPQISFEIEPPFTDIKTNQSAVWVATQSGLLKFDRERQSWRLFTEADGLLSNYCRQILLDGDYLWIANKGGITQFYWNNPYRSD